MNILHKELLQANKKMIIPNRKMSERLLGSKGA